MIKIWGTSFSLIGDLIMSLPQLNYFKKKYKDTYINFVIHKKIAYCAPLFFNHPYIDKIIISGEWSSFSSNDYNIASNCDVVTTKLDHKNKKILDRNHEDKYWYNKRSCIDETAFMSGITDFNDILSKNERIPYLNKWFDAGFEDVQKKGAYTYEKVHSKKNHILSKSVAIWPFAGYGRSKNRNPSLDWWKRLVLDFNKKSIKVFHFGYINEPNLSENNTYYEKLTDLDFFSQIKISLSSKLSIGTDSGSMWVLSAYSHPSLIISTNWYENHKTNLLATVPPNINSEIIFKENGFESLSVEEVFEKSIKRGVSSVNKIDKVFSFFK
tara:strand:+ start:145 stop:1122 length:978 start_codon:yes stop_codon:yes gene_type:complete